MGIVASNKNLREKHYLRHNDSSIDTLASSVKIFSHGERLLG